MPEKTSYSGTSSHTEKIYCVKCRRHIVVSAPELVKFSNGRHALRGRCPHCQTGCYQLISKDRADSLQTSTEG